MSQKVQKKQVEKQVKREKIIEKTLVKKQIKKQTLKKKSIEKKVVRKKVIKPAQVAKKFNSIKPKKKIESQQISHNKVTIPIVKEHTKTDEESYVQENLAQIIQLLQDNLYYPRRARKRGVEGDILVRFKLSKNGLVSDVSILSSKSDILSRGALKTIENIRFQLPKPKENLTLSVPISYRLR